MENYNVSELFKTAFGIKNVAVYRPETTVQNTGNGLSYTGVEVVEDVQAASRISYMGTPVIFPIKFRGQKYNFYNTSGEIEQFKVEDFELPAATLVNFRRAKLLSATNALANQGTVKETYGFADWNIEIRGLCVYDPGNVSAVSAYDQHLRLAEYENIVDSIGVTGDLFVDKNIHHLVIKEIDFKQLQGKPGVIPFYLRCLSDNPLELDLL